MLDKKLFLIYDKQCPLCDNYCQMVRIRESIGSLELIDARKDSAHLKQITNQGLDIDQGMVLIMNGQLYYGSKAVHVLALVGSRSGLFNRINYWVFSSEMAASALYPVLRFGRNLLLKLLGKTKINNLHRAGNNKF